MARPVKKKGPDRTLIFGAIGLVVIIAAAILMRACLSNKCPDEISFDVTGGERVTGSELTFRDLVGDYATSWDWDFGDGTDHSTEKEPTHTYLNPGDYTITLEINGTCQGSKVITILPSIQEETIVPEYVTPTISGPSEAFVGDPVQFFDQTSGANSWDWEFGESGDIDSHEKNPVYVFRKPGPHDVILNINGQNSNPARHTIVIKKKKETAKTNDKGTGGGGAVEKKKEEPKREKLTSKKFFDSLKEECERGRKGGANYLGPLGKYFGGTLSMAVIVLPNGKEPNLFDWIQKCQLNDCDFKYSEAEFLVDEFGDVNKVIIKK